MTKHTFAIVGNSNIVNRRILNALTKLRRSFRFILISRRETIEKPLIYDAAYTKLDDAIKSEQIKYAYVSTPNSLHYASCIILLKNGTNVFVDKPSVLNAIEVDELIKTAKKNKCFISQSLVYHYHSVWGEIYRLSRSKKILGARATFTIPRLPSENFRNHSELGGGVFNDMGPYFTDICSRLSGSKIKSVTSNYDGDSIFSPIFLQVIFENKMTFQAVHGFNLPYQNRLELIFQDERHEIERVFSPPEDTALQLKTFSYDGVDVKNFGPDDTFFNYFNEILELEDDENTDAILEVFERQNQNFFTIGR
jgi:predicted dehydrogenase